MMTTKERYDVYTCVECNAIQKIKEDDDGLSTCWELRDKYGWELFHSHGGATGKCPECQKRKTPLVTLTTIENVCKDYLRAQNRYEHNHSLEYIVKIIESYKESNNDMNVLKDNRNVKKAIEFITNAAQGLERVLA